VPTILVADDNSNIQKMVTLVFEEKGIRVVAVGNGEAACRKMSEVRPDIVLADVFMPVRSGYEVCEFVKHDSQFSGIPVILLVGAFDPLDEKEAKRVGADGVLKKPFVPPDPLIAMVTSLLPKIAPSAEPPAPPAKHEIPALPKEWTPAQRAPAVPTYELRQAVPEEFSFGSIPRDFDEPADTVPAFGEPVATPPAKHNEENDYEQPVSEWTRRRNTMEYDIPAAESSSMVEKLSGQATAEDSPSLERTDAPEPAQVPFGAEAKNVPEKNDPLPTPVQDEWVDLMGMLERNKIKPIEDAREVPASAAEEDPSTSASPPPREPLDNILSIGKLQETAPHYTLHEETQQHEASAQHEARRSEPARAHQTDWPAPPSAEAIPFPAPPEIASASAFETPSESRDAEIGAHETHEEFSYVAEPLEDVAGSGKSAPEETPATPTEVSATDSAVHSEPYEKEPPAQAADAAPAKPAEMDTAAIDSVVAKLLEKLEPQIHQALSNGILRPLVEEMLNREHDKK